MQLALVRHGQTDWNLAGRLQGSSDVPLNITGRAQAGEAAALLADEHWDLIISSPLGRASETAHIISDLLGVPLGEADPRLVERAYGQAEGITKQEAIARFGADLWPGEEAFEDLETRAFDAINDIAARHDGEDLVIVTHGTFIRAFVDAITGLQTATPDNAHSVRVKGTAEDWTVTDGLVLRE